MSAIRTAFWNVQNLFDTKASDIATDLGFTPAKGWTPDRLEQKLDVLASIINGMFGGKGPELLGLCEVENVELMRRLRSRLRNREDLCIAHVDSPDIRGIDTSLFYSSKHFAIKGDVKAHLIHLQYPTRDILEVPLFVREKGKVDSDSEIPPSNPGDMATPACRLVVVM